MNKRIRSGLTRLFAALGFELRRKARHESDFPRDFGPDVVELIRFVRPYTMTCDEKIFSLISAVRYVVNKGLPGDFVECGVFTGGSVMTIAKVLLQMGETDRRIFLYDTFEGMPRPTSSDVSSSGKVAMKVFKETRLSEDSSAWVNASVEQVRANLALVGYPIDHFVLVKGKVEDTLPKVKPDSIALLRLDTDFYSSTKAELEHLFPKLVAGGVIIFDDYGHWLGSKKAIDEYLSEKRIHLLLNRIDFSGRIAVKV